MTLRDAYSKNPKLSWTEFMNGVERLASQGFLLAKGDGFVVRYFLTNKGQNAIGVAH
jgi:hypothetical protein